MVNHQNSSLLRQEKKYILTLHKVNSFEKSIILKGFKINHLPNIVNNIYFDNFSFSSMNENIEGEMNRSKYRIRWYNNENKFVLENKLKISSSGKKEKTKLKSLSVAESVKEVQKLINKNPVIQNSYTRKYFINNNIRITIDFNINFNLPGTENFKSYKHAIVEIKFPTENQFDSSFKNIMTNYSQLTKFSKYLRGLREFNRV
jgi:SPX domain protein involved in polyphosphate accumulation